MIGHFKRLLYTATAAMLVLLSSPAFLPTQIAYAVPVPADIENRITTLSGLQAEDIDGMFAVEQAPEIVIVAYEISIPVQVEPRISYLLVRNASTGVWAVVVIDNAEWDADFRPYLQDKGVKIHRQPPKTLQTTSASAEAAQLALNDIPTETNANLILYGNASGPNGNTGGGGNPAEGGDDVGYTNGSFSVTQYGAAGYTIPILVAPGVAGLQPDISLSYNSRGSNGLLGVGWAISGLSSIARCGATFTQDGIRDGVDLEADDKYCLDGQRLIDIGSGQYRTEIETLQKVTSSGAAGNGPASFTVKDKAGLTREYGTVANSRIRADGKNEALFYAVNRITDRYQNFIEYEYETLGEKSTFRPKQITYGNNSGVQVGKVVFGYEDRTDTSSGFLAGSEVTRTKRLSTITTYTKAGANSQATTPVREYRLTYEHGSVTNYSHLAQVIECLPATNTCLAPTVIGWQQGSRGFTNSVNTNITESTLTSLKVMDVNNNGVSDYVYVRSNKWRIRFDSITAPEVNTGYTAHYHANNYNQVLDYNGDGYQDIVQRTPSGTTEVLQGREGGFTRRSLSMLASALTPSFTVAVDANGDGYDDIAYLDYQSFNPFQGWAGHVILRVYYGSATNLGATVKFVSLAEGGINGSGIDFVLALDLEPTETAPDSYMAAVNVDGDGRPDLLINLNASLRAVSFDGTTYVKKTVSPTTGGAKKHVKYLDANNDGLTDQLFYADSRWRLWVSDGVGYNEVWSAATATFETFFDHSGPVFNNNRREPIDWREGGSSTVSVTLSATMLRDAKVIDYNRDGRADILLKHGNLWKVLIAEGAGFDVAMVDTGKAAGTNHARAMLIDAGGDGLPDILYPQSTWRIYHQRGPHSGIVNSITNGLGAQTKIVYAPLTDSNVYIGKKPMAHNGNQPTAPYRHFASPLLVVKEFAADNGLGDDGAIHTMYEYGGAKIHSQGRGFVGFSEMRAWNGNRDIETKTTFRQDFPYVGATIEAAQYMPVNAGTAGNLGNYTIGDLDLIDEFEPECEDFPGNCRFMFPRIPIPPVQTSDKPVSKTTNVFSAITAYSGKVHLTYRSSSTVLSYPLTGGVNASPYKRAVTSFTNVDTFGNTRDTLITVDDGSGGDVHKVSTHRNFINDQTNWCIGLVDDMTVTQDRNLYAEGYLDNGTKTITNTTDFDYLPAQCLIRERTVEPNNGNHTDRTVTTTFAYDQYGNKASETASSPGLPSTRVATMQYGYDGRFVVDTRNAENHIANSSWDERFGLKTVETGPSINTPMSSNIETTWVYDDFGRLLLETAPVTAVTSTTTRDWCVTNANCRSPRSVFRVTVSNSDGSVTQQEYDRLKRVVLSRTKRFGGGFVNTESHYDPFGREYLVSQPYADGESVCYSFRQYDALDRVIKDVSPNDDSECGGGAPAFDASVASLAQSNVATIEYDTLTADGIETRATGPGANPRVVTKVRNVMDRVRFVYETDSSRPAGDQLIVTQYDYDAAGRSAWIRDSQGNETDIRYDILGWKTSLDDPNMGYWEYQHDPLGQLTYQKDANGNEVAIEYDKIGRMVKRIEDYPSGNAAHANAMVSEWVYDTALGDAVGKLAHVKGPYRQGTGFTTNDYEERYMYDLFGRVEETIRRVDGQYYWTSTAYDSLSRLDRVTYPAIGGGATATATGNDRLVVKSVYDADGFLRRVTDAAGSKTYWEPTGADARGNITHVNLGNGLNTIRAFDRATGYLESVTTSGPASIQIASYEWDPDGNLTQRKDVLAGLYEVFEYDDLHRLTKTHMKRISDNTLLDTDISSYDKVGNILSKDDLFTGFQYNDPNHVNAVTRVNANGSVRNYSYDLNGNMLTGAGRTITWKSFNKPLEIRDTSTNHQSTFYYGADRVRVKQVSVRPKAATGSATVTETTRYVSNIFERVDRNPSDGAAESTEYRHYISAGGESIAVVSKRANGAVSEEYLHKDHLGSIVAITNATGALVTRMSFDAWGKRRDVSDWTALAVGDFVQQHELVTGLTLGFTGHESLSNVGLVHMNGRIYDPEIGRFLSADPNVQHVEGTQGYNRYTYVSNNPLSYNDPTGYFLKWLWGKIRQLIPKALRPIADFIAGFIVSGGNVLVGLQWAIEGLKTDYLGQEWQSSWLGGGNKTPPWIIINWDGDDGGGGDDWSWLRQNIDVLVQIEIDRINNQGNSSVSVESVVIGVDYSSQRLIPVHPQTVCKMGCHGVDWTDPDRRVTNPQYSALDGAKSLPADILLVHYHNRAINGDFGPLEQLHAIQARKSINAAFKAFYEGSDISEFTDFENLTISVNGTENFRTLVLKQVALEVMIEPGYVGGRGLYQFGTVYVASRAGVPFPHNAALGAGIFGVGIYGRALSLYESGVRDAVELMGGALAGSNQAGPGGN